MNYQGYQGISHQCPPGTMPYVIMAGDNYYRLAIRFNTTVEAIIAANPGVNPNALRIGQKICMPMGNVPTCPGGSFYTVRPGDTFFSIARSFNVSLEDLIAANPNVDPARLMVGQVICIPGVMPPPVSCPTGTMTYVIKAGDTLYSLAIRFNTTVEAILAANPGLDPNSLVVGRIICIPVSPSVCPPGTTLYVIQAGDTLYSLAIRFNTTVAAIIAANPGIDPNALQIGQRICIPVAQPPQGCPSGTMAYIIKAGDTFYSLAIRFNTTVEAIIAANPGVNPNNLQIGQRVCIPVAQPPQGCPSGTMAYIIKAGDTFYSLAIRFHTTVEAIAAANPGVNPNNLQIGQRICIPTSM